MPHRNHGRAILPRRIAAAVIAVAVPLSAQGAATCTVPPIAPIAHGGTKVRDERVHLLDTTRYPDALCNDGTPGGYVFRPGYGLGRHRWVIELQGGRECEDNATCATRATNLTSTMNYTSGQILSHPLEGILSADPAVNPDFYDANAVRVLYCSSDFWSGDKAPVAGTSFSKAAARGTWYFRGRAIAVAAVKDLRRRHLREATEILLTGDSAGGIGITLDANDLLPLTPSGARTLVANDAGFTLDIGAYDAGASHSGYVSPNPRTPGDKILAKGHAFWGGRGDRLCDAAATTPDQRLQCYRSDIIISTGFLAPPVAVTEALDDTAQLADDGLPKGRPQMGSPEAGYALSFATAMTANLQAVGADNSAYGPYAFAHQQLTGSVDGAQSFDLPHQFPAPDNGLTPQQFIGQWYLDPCQARQVIGTSLEPPPMAPEAAMP